MSDPTARPTPDDLRARVEAAVAACVEALELGERDPAPRLCAGDDELLARVRKRLTQLAAHGLIPSAEPMPTAIGPYRIVRELGSGGMGQVFLAAQTEPVQRDVALKVVKLGLDTREVLARFQAERQALARMSHPGIAQVFDAGMTPAGRPYFAMEYVPGEMLTAYCDERRLDVEARVRLMATICRAVQHAHDRGFIHRDLKPSNILVTEHEGTPSAKIIDFGVAKAMAGGPDDATRIESLRTRDGQVLGTPEYMSPEQMALDGGDIDTRADVYALGATLYQLLCGELPFDSQRLRRAGWRELEAILRDELPPPPSRRCSHGETTTAAARHATPTGLARELAGELDWIVGKAMAKGRAERYPSALAFAEDLERWLRHDPVLAAPPGRVYRLRKFVRRHRVAVAAGLVVFASLAVGLAVSLRATARAEAARAREAAALGDMRAFFGLARDAVANLVEVADAQLLDVPQAEPARRRMLADAMGFYESLRARQPGDDGLQRERLTALQRIAQLQRQLGDPALALATADDCAAELRVLRSRAPDDAAVVALGLETASLRAAALDALGRNREAADVLQAALDELGASGLAGVDGARARLLANLAGHRRDQPNDAIALYDEALRAIDRSGGAAAADVRARAAIAIELAEALTRVDRLADADRTLASAAAAMQRLAQDDAAAARTDAARIAESRAGVLRRLGRIDEARLAQQQAVALHEALAQEHPDVPAHGDGAAAGWQAIGQDELALSRYDEALAAAQRAVATRKALTARFPALHRQAMRLSRALLAEADIEIRIWRNRRGDADAPPRTLAAAATIVDPLHEAHPDDLEVTFTYCAVHTASGGLAAVRGDLPQALVEHRRARDAAAAALARHGDSAEVRQQLVVAENNLFQAHHLADDPGEARAAAERGLEHLEAGLRLDARHLGLRDLFAPLTGRVAIARMRVGDVDGGVELLAATCRRTDRGDDAREQAALLLSQQLTSGDEPAASEQLELVRSVLAERLVGRGDLAAAQQRPAQLGGASQAGSRLRDFDLRVALGQVAEALGDDAIQAKVLAEARELATAMPGLAADRLRNLYAQSGELALRQGEPAAAVEAARALLAQTGEHGGGNYLAAGLLAGAVPNTGDGSAKDALCAEAIACLRRALADREVPAAAIEQPRFAPLLGRPDYEALRR